MSHPARDVDWRQVRRFLVFSGFALAIAAALGVLYFSLLLPLCVSAFFAYLLVPFVARLERYRVRRSIAVSAIVFAFCAVSIFAVARLVPLLYQQVLGLLQLVPRAMTVVMEQYVPLLQEFLNELGVGEEIDLSEAVTAMGILQELRAHLQSGFAGLWATATSVFGGVVNVMLVPVITFVLLLEHNHLMNAIRSVIPRDLVRPVESLSHKLDTTIRGVIKGQLTVAAILTILYVIGFAIVDGVFGMQSAIAIAVVAGICRVIPYFDVIVGATLSLIVILSDYHGIGPVLGVTAVFVVVQTLDGILITPRVIGERIGLHPLVVILSVFAFADWFGFWGVLLVIPTIAIIKTLIVAAMPYYKASHAFVPTAWRQRRRRRRGKSRAESESATVEG